ncbi:hypothetical protein THICB1_100362 [Thiomonas arsenitoxydans]|uniref:Uncharacterized protein n=1 Tax=Thiomonas arsenitoxydans (strain DSM 22701 / CIP 110005 / 3As) TaxID=426114 RepID=A0ABM9T0I0_THIA3|nr:hypothetical protein THICB1_100362 [Thiomonas arsenitoxydans]CQR30266.1 hypothetical protein ACO3_220066 [Thiomonas arsenitoxydans]CQR30322.1 hypothetical protein ACO7_200066 [Thiomonas arsenitoxydans]CQR32304.1 hypothetical protein THICB6_160161 [Thiomonas arsenitoxydans]
MKPRSLPGGQRSRRQRAPREPEVLTIRPGDANHSFTLNLDFFRPRPRLAVLLGIAKPSRLIQAPPASARGALFC